VLKTSGAPRFKITTPDGIVRFAGAAAAARALARGGEVEVACYGGYDGTVEQVVRDYLADQSTASQDYRGRLKASLAIKILENDARRPKVVSP